MTGMTGMTGLTGLRFAVRERGAWDGEAWSMVKSPGNEVQIG
jgi:hypothetical protein